MKDEDFKKPIPRGNSFFESGNPEENHCKILSHSKHSVENLRYNEKEEFEEYDEYQLSENSPLFDKVNSDLSVTELVDLLK